MTCIAAIAQDGKVYMGSDAGASDEDAGIMVSVASPKVFIKDEYIIGYAGSFRVGKFMQHTVELPKPPSWAKGKDKLDEFMNGYVIPAIRKQVRENELEQMEKEDFSMLVGLRGHIFEINEDWSAFESADNFMSVGSGCSLAIGSLYSTANWTSPKRRISVALEASIRYNLYCSAPITILEV